MWYRTSYSAKTTRLWLTTVQYLGTRRDASIEFTSMKTIKKATDLKMNSKLKPQGLERRHKRCQISPLTMTETCFTSKSSWLTPRRETLIWGKASNWLEKKVNWCFRYPNTWYSRSWSKHRAASLKSWLQMTDEFSCVTACWSNWRRT